MQQVSLIVATNNWASLWGRRILSLLARHIPPSGTGTIGDAEASERAGEADRGYNMVTTLDEIVA
jgi:hypothetical protein